MNKKYIILIVFTFILLLAAGFGLNYYLTHKKVTINIKKPGITAEVYKSNPTSDELDNGQKVASLTTSGDVLLDAGKYYITPKGKNYDDAPIIFIVKDSDTSVSVDPTYSNAYLQEQIKKESDAIKMVITKAYPAATSNFIINTGKLYQDGSWYGTTMVEKVGEKNNGDVYRLVLRKQEDSWRIVAIPKLVLTSAENKDIPIEILSDLNRATGY